MFSLFNVFFLISTYCCGWFSWSCSEHVQGILSRNNTVIFFSVKKVESTAEMNVFCHHFKNPSQFSLLICVQIYFSNLVFDGIWWYLKNKLFEFIENYCVCTKCNATYRNATLSAYKKYTVPLNWPAVPWFITWDEMGRRPLLCINYVITKYFIMLRY